MFVKKLKGGSLASTDVIEENGEQYVLKRISLKSNREYGYYRWQSQLRMLISYSNRWPTLFPEILDYGVDNGYAFYKIRYYKDWVNAYEYLQQDGVSVNSAVKLAKNILSGIGSIHSVDCGVGSRGWELFYAEEIDYAIESVPQEIIHQKSIKYNGKDYPSLFLNKQKFYDIGNLIMTNIGQSEVHGNLTLENILVSPNFDLMFIDPYFEVGIGTPLGDYAQLLQSTNSNYEYVMILIDQGKYTLSSDYALNIQLEKSSLVEAMNEVFIDFVNGIEPESFFRTRWLEVAQYIRMLPFKFASNQNAGVIIYIYTCYLLDKFIGEFNDR